MSRVHFLYALSVISQNRVPIESVPIKRHEFLVDPDEAYDLRMLQFKGRTAPPTESSFDAQVPKPVTIICDKEVLLPIVDRSWIVGRYDQLRFSFRTSNRLGAGTVLQVGPVTVTDTDQGLGDYVPSVSLPFRISVGAWEIALLVIGLGIFIFGPALLPPMRSPRLREILSGTAQALGIILALISRERVRAATRSLKRWFHELLRLGNSCF
jgi:hypothetical protein